MTNYNLEEAELVKFQILLSFVLLLTTVVSITLSYNFLLNLENKTPIYDDEESTDILLLNRMIMFIVSALFIYINIRDKNVKEKYDSEDEFADLQISASVLNFIAAAIVLYVGIKSGGNIISGENPTI